MEQTIIIENPCTLKIIERRAYMNEYMKEYRKSHKKEWNPEKYKCEICGTEYTKSNKSHHYKSRRHELAELKQKLEVMKKLLIQ